MIRVEAKPWANLLLGFLIAILLPIDYAPVRRSLIEYSRFALRTLQPIAQRFADKQAEPKPVIVVSPTP